MFKKYKKNLIINIFTLLVVVLMFLLLVSTGITISADESVSDDANKIERGGTLIFGKNQTFSLDPAHYVANVSDKAVTYQIFETLIKKDDKGNFYPSLAESYEVQKNGEEIVFQLRKDVLFHDGEKFNAEAVKATFDWYLSEECNAMFLDRM